MRVYVGTVLHQLKRLRDNGFTAPVNAHAVTPALREWYVDGNSDELEYAASEAAARDSLRQLAGSPHREARRVVVAADVADAVLRAQARGVDDSRRSAVQLVQPLTLAHVVSIHVDDGLALADVAAAAAAVAAADAGDEDAQFTVDAADGHELLWYDVSELDDVLRLNDS